MNWAFSPEGSLQGRSRPSPVTAFLESAVTIKSATPGQQGGFERMQSEQSATVETGRAAWSRNNPYTATALENRLLTGPGSEKETRHIELDLADSGIEYVPGDSAGILPVNTCDAVDLVLERLQFTGDEPVVDFYGKPLDLRQALTSWLMIGKLSGATLKGWAKHTGNPELAALTESGNKEKLDAWLWGREFLDLLEHCPAKLDDPQQLFKLLPRLAPRLYSTR